MADLDLEVYLAAVQYGEQLEHGARYHAQLVSFLLGTLKLAVGAKHGI